MQRGGEVLAVGHPSTPVQFIDVRDLAEWIIRMVEKRGTGIYNATGPVPSTNLAQLIDAARATARAPPRVTWVTSSWVSTQKERSIFDGLRFWEFNEGYLTGFSNARALADGLTTRSVRVTMADEWSWLKQQPQTGAFTGFGRKRDGSGFEPLMVPWPAYLEHEKKVLSAWHAKERKQR